MILLDSTRHFTSSGGVVVVVDGNGNHQGGGPDRAQHPRTESTKDSSCRTNPVDLPNISHSDDRLLELLQTWFLKAAKI